MGLIDTIAQQVNFLVGLVQYIIGGIFGLYLILIYLRWKESRTVRKLLTEIKDELKIMNKNNEQKIVKKKK